MADLEDDDPSFARGVLRDKCAEWLAAAYALRKSPWPGKGASPFAVSEALVQARANLDNLETIYGHIMALRAASEAKARELEVKASDAWDKEANDHRREPRREYEGSQERYAYWRLATRIQLLEARDAREFADFVKGTYDRIKLCYDGLNELRRDLASRLTHLRWEKSMES